jgi:hypothetical protein
VKHKGQDVPRGTYNRKGHNEEEERKSESVDTQATGTQAEEESDDMGSAYPDGWSLMETITPKVGETYTVVHKADRNGKTRQVIDVLYVEQGREGTLVVGVKSTGGNAILWASSWAWAKSA